MDEGAGQEQIANKIDGWYARHEHHVIYWKLLPDRAVGVVNLLHEPMHQLDRFREDAGEP
ncbi:hypothetical protein BH11PSE1_BH11PSE1_04930 [soil metagenome]